MPQRVLCRLCCRHSFSILTSRLSLFCRLVCSYTTQFFLEALIFVVLVADFTTSPSQVNDTLAAGIFFTTTTQNVLEIAAIAVTVVIVGLHTFIIVIVAATAAVAAATAANLVSKVSDQRQLR